MGRQDRIFSNIPIRWDSFVQLCTLPKKQIQLPTPRALRSLRWFFLSRAEIERL